MVGSSRGQIVIGEEQHVDHILFFLHIIYLVRYLSLFSNNKWRSGPEVEYS